MFFAVVQNNKTLTIKQINVINIYFYYYINANYYYKIIK